MINKRVGFLGTFNGGTTAGSKLQFELPTRGSYYAFAIRAKHSDDLLTDAELASVIGDVEMVLSGRQVIKSPALRLKQLAQLQQSKSAANDGIIPILGYVPYFDLYNQRFNLSWAMKGVSSATLYINIANPGSLTGITFELYADYDPTDIDRLGAYACYGYQDFVVAGAGQFDVNTVNTYGKGTAIRSHHLELVGGTNPTIDSVQIELNNNVLINNMTPTVNAVLNGLSRRESVIGTSPFALDLIYDGANIPTAAWIMDKDFKMRLRATIGGSAAPTAIRVHTMYIEGIS